MKPGEVPPAYPPRSPDHNTAEATGTTEEPRTARPWVEPRPAPAGRPVAPRGRPPAIVGWLMLLAAVAITMFLWHEAIKAVDHHPPIPAHHVNPNATWPYPCHGQGPEMFKLPNGTWMCEPPPYAYP